MRTWNLTSNDPGAFTIAADARFGPTDYTNDHIWELVLRGGEPPALGVQTTFGLRARQMKLFPRFTEGDSAISDPDQFDQVPTVHQYFPNYLAINCRPYTGIDVTLEYWVPDSHTIAGRVHFKNTRLSARLLYFEWVAMLSAAEGGEKMISKEIEAATILTGYTGDLSPMLFMTGGPEHSSGPFPALGLEIELPTGSERSFTWVMVSENRELESFNKAREMAVLSWDKALAQVEIINDGLIEIETGDESWNTAFALTQNFAFGSLIGPTENLPHLSFATSRQPNHGFSPLGDGSDYSHLWNGQTPLEAVYLSKLLLPSSPEIAKGLLLNFLSVQKYGGFIDWKPGLGNQQSGVMATPILAHMAWQIYKSTEDKGFLGEVYGPLLAFIQGWFDQGQDRDGDGIPEWSHSMQAGFEEHPTFSQGQPWTQGADISFSESPALCALLYNEINILIRMAGILERSEPLPSLQSLADHLKQAINASWDNNSSMYKIWDRETHRSPKKQLLAKSFGPGEILLDRNFDEPARLLVSIKGQSATPRQAIVFIHGTNASGKNTVERFSEDTLQWRLRQAYITSQRVYSSLEYLDIRNLEADDLVTVEVVDFANQDYSLFLPLFAKIPTPERAKTLIQATLLDPATFWQPFGIPMCAESEPEVEQNPGDDTSVIWCSLIGGGLLKYGCRKEAAELVSRLMNAITLHLEKHKSFAQSYNSGSGQGVGEHNSLQGLAPLSLFLDVLGLQVISPIKVRLEGQNPFPWPVTVKYRGLTVLRELDKTRVTFPGGQTAVIKSPNPQVVELFPVETSYDN